MSEFDLVIRNGTVIDGSGKAGFKADVGVKAGLIAAVGVISGKGAQEIDATGKIVTPGFVDVHTHYDGQVTWENTLAPSSNHGATTVITGNCGVGFAPCRAADREKLVTVMEGVEDIPEIVMTEGLPWNWESFPDYLDAVAARQFDIDVGVQIPHSPIRVFVMGDRGVNQEASTEADRKQMADIVTEAIQAGAIGVTTSRSGNHRAKDGTLAPSVRTADEEVLALAKGLGAAKAGVFQIIPESSYPPEGEMDLIERVAAVSKRPVSFTLAQTMDQPDGWRGMVAGMEKANRAGHQVRGQIMARPVGVLLGLDLSYNPLTTLPSYRAIADKPLAEKVAIMRDPAFKAKVLAEEPIVDPVPLNNRFIRLAPEMFLLGKIPNYLPSQDMKVGERAKRLGVDPMSLVYDLLLEEDGHAILYLPSANFADGTTKVAREMLMHPDTILGLGDGGAHYGIICDAGYPTFILTYWTRQAPEDQRISLETAIAELTRRPAETVGLFDRGLVQTGYKADLNVIDYDHLTLYSPQPVYNLPTGARRLQQKADGYEATIVNGQVTYRNGQSTGALPGRLVRGDGFQPRQRAAA